MLSQTVRLSTRVAARNVRSFSACAVRSNLIQDLYLKELKSFKPTPISPKDAEGNVKPWTPPAAPQPPKVEADAASDLEAYAAAPVEVEGVSAEAEETPAEEWFVLEEIHDAH